MTLSSATTVREQQPAPDVEKDAMPGLALIYSRWHRDIASAFPFYNPVETLGRDLSNSIPIPDAGVSRFHAHFERRSDGSTWVVDRHSTNGTRVNGRRVDEQPLREHDILRMGDACFRFVARRIYAYSPYGIDGTVVTQARPFTHALERGGLVGGYQMDALMERATKLAPANISIVIHGESGTGKELLARAIHEASARRGPFVAINCGAIPETLIESELFGYRRGAFTGAQSDRDGLVSAADGGTLFLDEIGDMPARMQAKLLRVLQEREVTRLGETRATSVDLRVVCATHRDLDQMVAAGTFRPDLYARLRDVTLRLPALRERREDLYRLVLHFAAKFGRPQVELSNGFMTAVAQHSWPMNVRELESALRVAVKLSGGEPLDLQHLPDSVRSDIVSAAPVLRLVAPPREPPPREAQKLKPSMDILRELMVRKRGNVAAVARRCRVHRMQVYRWLASYGLDAAAFR